MGSQGIPGQDPGPLPTQPGPQTCETPTEDNPFAPEQEGEDETE